MIHSTVFASAIVAQGFVNEDAIYYYGVVALFGVLIYLLLRAVFSLFKAPSDKTLRDISDSIIAESQKNRKAIEELTRAIRESKEK
ncbi:MAG: hypothetical protein EOM12_09795 [Verrucomicrobiae bacterium]|nr:hypothetical protein [Verrucomicrobiae bacterium]